MATYTCTVEQWDDDSDVIRGFQAEVSGYGHQRGYDPQGWEVSSPIVEIGEDGEVIGELAHPVDGDPLQRRLHAQVTKLLIADAMKQWDEEEHTPPSRW